MTDTPEHTSYDDVPYPSFPMGQTHPDRLATLAVLFGMDPPPVEGCRVLELGCADGGNLLAMAEALPAAEFVGIDLSAQQITAGQAAVAALGLDNVKLHRLSITDVPAGWGLFDYIICHGVYSWVPAEVREHILEICRTQLTPQGVAYVSYNVYPGWHGRSVVRDAMRFYSRNLEDAPARTARARDVLAFFLETIPDSLGPYRQFLKEEQDRLNPCRDSYIFHEHLEECNAPVYFHQFAAEAGRHGLQFLAEADYFTMMVHRFSPPVAAALEQFPDVVDREQYRDFLTNRMFRQTLLCRQDIALQRQLRPEVLPRFFVASRAKPVSPRPDIQSAKVEEFRGSSGVGASTSHSISKMAFILLGQMWPQAIAFNDLEVAARARLVGEAVVVQEAAAYARDTRLLAENLLQAYTAGIIELHVFSPPLVTEPGERPLAGRLARWQARDATAVANLRQQMVQLDPMGCHLLRQLDGSNDRAALLDRMVQTVLDNNIPVERNGRPVRGAERLRLILARELEPNLRRLARSGLLVA